MSRNDNIYICLNNLIDLSLEAQISPPAMNYKAYVQEFCTIALKGPRQAGHTTAIIRTINDKEMDDVLILTYNASMRHLYDPLRDFPDKENIKISTVSNNLNNLVGSKYSYIFVDGASMIPKNKMDRVIDMATAMWTGGPKILALIQ